MRIHKVQIKNFRLLADAELALEEKTTVIVGRNNSGKTSLSEVMRRLLADGSTTFQLEDFSSASYDGFCDAHQAHQADADEIAVRALLPVIELRLHFRYDPAQPQLGPLAPFVIDLDPDCGDALLVIRYELKDGGIAGFFEGQPDHPLNLETRRAFFRTLRERIPTMFTMKIWAEDPNDADNRRQMQPVALRHLVKTGFINAQRGLDDVTSKESDVLAKVLEGLFSTAASEMADAGDKLIADALTTAVQDIQAQMDDNFGGQLQKLLPTLQSFGYPGLGGQELHTETTLDVRRLLSNFTKVRYAGYSGVALPESYNGLGVRNLIFILLQLVGFYKAFRAEPIAPGVHLIFIEEPEAHLHPQMQEVFIRRLAKIAQQLADGADDAMPWPVQFVVSTHSSHIANEAGFESIRYFLGANIPGAQPGVRQTKIKDLREGLAAKPAPEKQFLHQYLTLTRCDLFFADKAVLVEGLSERLMLPIVVGKLETAEPAVPKLSTQYTTVMEVGGAYAHIFVDLLEFLELQSLIVTDLDAVLEAGGMACAVHEGTTSSNACLKAWFPRDDPFTLDGLKGKSDDEKRNGRNRVAYQCAEADGGPCGRTFEDAFILANATKFGVTGATANELELAARKEAGRHKKSSFALTYAIADTDWVAPKYLLDGIRWLAADEAPAADPVLTLALEAAAAEAADVGGAANG
ncbi:ATP-dependent nuclease [Agrobacterium cavarae]|uniref:ATP-dependent nuclease n=1 Tax=Agrobacterium cavarae TaxID=2528239 RepID=UPI0028A0F9A0|nr:ATP-dependent endonuclease [Agrobacterium cavarae]